MTEINKKKIKINYVDFWSDLDKENFKFTRVLRKYYDVEISDDPDYVFCSCFSNKHFDYDNCVKILFLGENIVPDFNLYDYAIGFHFIEFEDRYLRYPLYVLYEQSVKQALEKHTFSDEYYLEKKKFCNYVISNPNAASQRNEMIDALSKYMQVDSGGRYRNNVGGPVKDKLEFASKYRFSMTFENSSMSGYVTEKIFEGFAAATIPIYWGSARIAEDFNPDSFVNCHDFENFEQVVKRVQEIYENDELFLKMVKAPILIEGCLAKKYFEDSYIEDFLRNIFDQEPSKAIRRNMVYIGHDYQHKQKNAMAINSCLDIVRKPMHLYKKTKAQILSKKKK